MPEAVRRRESILLPHDQHARYTHRHALWSDVFFEWTDTERLRWPADIHADRVRDAAVFHHNPAKPEHWLIVEADRMAAGLDRKERDAADDSQPAGRQDFRRVSLLSTLTQIAIGRGDPPRQGLFFPAKPLSPAALMPSDPKPDAQPGLYEVLWTEFQHRWCQIVAVPDLDGDRLEQALLALSRYLLWAVPSSTQHQPDISLHDHAHTVAAIAACLAVYHAAAGDERAIRDRKRCKFRFVELDLSGIQAALLRLRSEQARGTARILRARSFLIGATLDGVVLRLRQTLGLPASAALLAAGGRARLLAADVPGLEARLASFTERLDRWMVERWQGDLALPIGIGPAFTGDDFASGSLWQVEAKAAAALETAKQRPLSGFGTGIVPNTSFQKFGQCQSCGTRPAEIPDRNDADLYRCRACDEAHQLGRALPQRQADGVALLPAQDASDPEASLFDGVALTTTLPKHAAAAWVEFGFTEADAVFRRAAVPVPRPHLPRIGDPAARRYEGLEENVADGLKTFGHIAADALEEGDRGLVGRRLLAILKADVDRLGIVFGHGLVAAGRTPARIAQLSRLMDEFFGYCLPDLLRRQFADTYTVYAGGDDLLLVCPWRFGAPLALALREEFRRFSACNPNLTLSAGLAFVQPEQPLNRAVMEAEKMLEQAKSHGRDRLGLLGRDLTWEKLHATLELSDQVLALLRNEKLLRNGKLPRSVLRTAQGMAREREKAEGGDSRYARWWPRWRYYRARFEERIKNDADALAAVQPVLDALLPRPGLPTREEAELAATFALWRDR
jgi:CRISPR-associated protein Csm1